MICPSQSGLLTFVHFDRYHGNEEILPREEFEARKKAAEELRASRLTKKTHKLAHMGKDLIGYPLLQVSNLALCLCVANCHITWVHP